MTYYIDLITRYFSGEASPEELMSLSEWIKESDENRKLFEDYGKAWNLTEQSVIDEKIDLDAEWSVLSGKINFEEKHPEPKVINISAAESAKKGNGKNWLKLAATLLILIASATFVYYYFGNSSMVSVTADAGIREVTLPDGSVISLNQGSTLEYPKTFRNKRTVRLEGEAYFKVAHDAGKPFIVKGNESNVEVLGTQFNVKTRNQQGNLEVVLTSGKVSLYTNSSPSKKMILSPGDQAEVSPVKNSIIRQLNTDMNYLAWKTRKISFDDTRMDQVIATLKSVYGVELQFTDPGLAECTVTASFDQQPLTSVLKVITSTLDLKVQQKGSIFILSGKACK
ncbi:MAG: FecR domain-containing protein [Bacteroidales bacterium]|nr:FecR domain-containing protein [Bacteroidales bacterium]